jgi:hypothetical protein
MMVPPAGVEILGWTEERSKVYYDEDAALSSHPNGRDPEFIHFNSGFAVQWHPEMMPANTPANQWLLNYINQHVAL